MTRKLGLEEALDIAMDAELKARAFYAQAAVQTSDPKGRDLLSRLAAFEQYHYQKLSELAKSLQDEGAFIDYAPRTMAQFAPGTGAGEAAGTPVEELKDETAILTKAIENEKIAGERYKALVEETADPKGKAMFQQLAQEERMHERILEDEFFSLSNKGVWGWSGLYGE
ncbi:MAG: ferritin family protein [Anaerolineae bacterium]|jgi:rubrerythrin